MTEPADWRELARVEAALTARWPESKIDPTLDRIRALTDLLGSPHQAYPVIHITGTNGKTSTARIVDTLLRGFGLRTGRFTSPHLASITERVAIDGAPLSPGRFAEVYRDVEPYLDLVDRDSANPLSMFEAVTGMAFAAFADAPVDVAVVEVGLGGTWDTTNVVDGRVAVITPIGLDHTNRLGDTVAEIATDKAGIIKPDATAVLAGQDQSAATELLRRAGDVGATVAREGLEFAVTDRRFAVGGQQITIRGLSGTYDELFLPLHGAHQAQNAATALAAVEAFFGATATTGSLAVEVVREALAQVSSPGRLETIRSAPTVLIDAAHNPAGMAATVAALAESFAFSHLVAVVGVSRDKNATEMLRILEPMADQVVVTRNSTQRAMPVDELASYAVEVLGADRVTVEPRLDDALETAVRLAEEAGTSGDAALSGTGVLVTGSVITVGEARVLLGGATPA